MAEADDRFVYTISGVKVVFPCKAYPTQLSMMNMIIRGIERQQNSLLESPTGSGKSLALLCSCLAWQAAEYEKKAKLEEQMNAAALESEDDECCGKACGGEDKSFPTDPEVVIKSEEIQHNSFNCAGRSDIEVPQKTEAVATPMQTTEQNESLVRGNESGSPTDDDFLPAKKRFRTPGNQATPSCKKRRVHTPLGASCEDDTDHEPPEWRMELSRDGPGENVSPGAMDGNDNKEKCSVDGSSKRDGKSETLKVPKIFFGTRTHKQIAQISRELRKTEYKRVRMTILSSREHSCVHPIVSKGKNKNEECRKLLDGSAGTTCKYFQKVHTIKSQMSLKCHGLNQAWDVEDLVKLGGQIKACSYYAARELMKEADIIFCPYNYLIDPKIRMQMDISLKDQIVVLDEAHNVEDSAREAASLTLTAVDLQNTLDELDRLVHLQVLTEHHRALHLMVGSFLRWIHESSSQLKERGFEQSSKVWSGMEIIAAMEKQGITPATFKLHSEHFQFVMTSAKDPNRQGMPALSSHGASLLEGVFLVGRFMMENNMQYICDYRCAILKTSVMVRDVHVLPGGWRRSHGGMRKEWTHSLNFWCLNPAVVFSELGSQTRCIVLTSGTLSPMGSFSSELGIKFPIQLEANHVIANSQVWVGTLSAGPSGLAINASFHSSETFTFQDEVGKMVLNVCETVPHGVLCFFPSYNMLDKLSKRWQSTGLWSKLLDRKTVVSEPRGGDKSEFDDIMHQFYHAIRASEDEECTELDSDDESSVDGGLFLAVCRGKVSEGLDFADNNARAVITVGIPFPNVKDVQVELKRKYNTQYAASRGLLTGSEWYEIQAYRALNQALGRCIRHKQDWGAILLIDERFNKSPKYINGISKWLRKRIAQFTNFTMAMSSLKEFTSARKLEPFPSSTSPGSLSQLSRSTVETPAKEVSVHTDTKPAEEHAQLRKIHVNSFGGFTPKQNVHTDTKPAEEHTQLGKTQANSFGGFTPRQNVHTETKPVEEHTQLGKTQVNSFGGFTPRQNVHTDQLNRGTVETPAKTQNVNTDTKPAVEHTPLGKAQLNSSGGFTTGSSVYTDTKPYVEHTPLTKAQRILNGLFTPRKNVRTNIQAFFTCNPEAKPQVNPNGAFTPSVSGHTNVLKPSNAQGNPDVVFTPSQVTNISAPGVTSKIAEKNGNVAALKTASIDQGKKERKVFNGMTSVVDYFSLTPVKSRELKTDVKVENKASDCAVERNLECETLSDEQLSTSPVLFTTPHSTPSTSPVKQEPNLFTFSQGEDRTGINSSNLNRVSHEPRENKCLGKQDSNAGTDSTDTSKKGDNIIGPSLTRNDTIIEEAKVDNVFEPSLATDAGNENGVPLRKLFRSRETVVSVTGRENHTEGAREGKKSRDLLDDVKETLAVEKATDLANSLQSAETTLETDIDSKVVASCSKRSRIFSKSVSDVPSNVRQAARRSTRLRRSSSSTGNTKKKQEETKEERQEDGGNEPVLSCTHCGSSLVTGAISSRPFAKHVPDTLRSSLLQTVDEKNVLVIDRAACEILNLSPLIELKNDHAPGVKLNSIFAPENDCCYIPQICRVCQSANGDPRIVGLEVVSFNSSSEKEPIQPNPPKQINLRMEQTFRRRSPRLSTISSS